MLVRMKKYRVTLMEAERRELRALISAGKGSARRLAHARLLLKADQGPNGPGLTDEQIAAALELSRPTVERIRKRFVSEGLAAALDPRPSPRTFRRKLDGEQEAQLVTLACSAPPRGAERWTLRLLANRLVELEVFESVSYETVRQVLKKTNLSLG